MDMMREEEKGGALSSRPEDRPVPVPGAELWRWAAPWLVFLVLAAAVPLGLLAAARAPDAATAWAGWGTAILAGLGLLGWLRQAVGGGDNLLQISLVVGTAESLVILVFLMAILAISGLLLAAHWPQGVLHDAGWALFAVALLMIFGNLKAYFDRSER